MTRKTQAVEKPTERIVMRPTLTKTSGHEPVPIKAGQDNNFAY